MVRFGTTPIPRDPVSTFLVSTFRSDDRGYLSSTILRDNSGDSEINFYWQKDSYRILDSKLVILDNIVILICYRDFDENFDHYLIVKLLLVLQII